MIPNIYQGKPIYANDIANLIAEVKSNRITSVAGGSFTRGIHGTCLKLTGSGGGGGGSGNIADLIRHPYRVSYKIGEKNPNKPNDAAPVFLYVEPISYLFGSMHYWDKITLNDKVSGCTWNQSADIVYIEVVWTDEGVEYNLNCFSAQENPQWGGEIEAIPPEVEGTAPTQKAARLILATITPQGDPNSPENSTPLLIEQHIRTHLRLATSFGQDLVSQIYFDAVVFADHASTDPQERFRSAFGNALTGWTVNFGNGYSSFAQSNVEHIKNIEFAVGDPNNEKSSGFSLIVGDLPQTDLFQLYSAEESGDETIKVKKIFGKWTEKLEFGLNLQDGTGKLLINDSGDPALSLTRLDYDIGIVANTMGYANEGAARKAPIITLYSNTDYIYLSLYGSTKRAQFRIEDREVENPSKIEIDKWSIYGQGPRGQIMFWSWENDLEYKLEWNGNYIKMQVKENGYNPKLTLYRTEDKVGIILDPSGKYKPSATEAPIVALFSDTDYIYSTIYGSQGQGQVGVRDNSHLFKIEIDKWSIYGFGSEKENVFWAGWEDDIELTLRRDTGYIKCLIDNDGNPNLDLYRGDYLCGISLKLMGNIPNPEDRDAPLLNMFSNTAEIYASICGSNSQAQICVKDPGTLGYSLELEKWSIRGRLGRDSIQKELWMQWGQNLEIKLTDGATDSSMLVHADYIQRKVGEVTSYALFTPDGAGTGDILYYNADTEQWQSAGITPSEGDMLMFYNNAWVRLEAGEDGKVLTMLNGLPHWTDNEGGLPEGGIPGDVLRMGENGPYWENTSICY
jgi:hypothetical protein